MADAVSVSIAKAIVSQIADATLSQTVTSERSYADWEFDLSKADNLELRDCDKLRVDVVGHMSKQRVSLATRGKLQYVVPVDIAVRRKLGADKQNDDTGRICVTEVDALLLLVQELHLMFTKQILPDFEYAVWDNENGGSEILWAPNGDHLRQWRQFTGMIRIWFRANIDL